MSPSCHSETARKIPGSDPSEAQTGSGAIRLAHSHVARVILFIVDFRASMILEMRFGMIARKERKWLFECVFEGELLLRIPV